MNTISRLLDVMAALRHPQTGCPWDLQQDFASIAPYTIEEAYEVADAIEREDLDHLRDELGDLLLQVVYHARLAEEQGAFSFHDIVAGIVDKMVRRHPHVFGDAEIENSARQTERWESMKAEERQGGALAGVALALPALLRADKLGSRAARVGFDWPDVGGVRDKVSEELAELDAAIAAADSGAVEHELGDLLFSLAQLGRHLGIDAEAALRAQCRRFQGRFEAVEGMVQARGGDWTQHPLEQLELFWQEAKKQ